jgi:hypothetical protein
VAAPVEVPADAPEVGCEESAEVSDFLVRFFFVVVELSAAAELSALAAPEEASASADFLLFFFFVVVLESAEALVSADCESSAAAAFFDFFFFVVVEESSLDADCELASAVESSAVFFFFFFLVVVELSDWLWSVDCAWLDAVCAARTLKVPKTNSPISIKGKYSFWLLLILSPSAPPAPDCETHCRFE